MISHLLSCIEIGHGLLATYLHIYKLSIGYIFSAATFMLCYDLFEPNSISTYLVEITSCEHYFCEKYPCGHYILWKVPLWALLFVKMTYVGTTVMFHGYCYVMTLLRMSIVMSQWINMSLLWTSFIKYY